MIRFNNVRKTYPEFDMEIGFGIGEGELVSILGPSGSGKTTMLRLIAGFEQPDSGTIEIDGRDVTGLSPADRQIGYVFQDYTLFPHMNVAENVGYGLRVRHRPSDEIADKVSELLELVDLPGYEERIVTTLSGGERQRIAIARALAVNPVLLLLDEPFSSIDEVLRRDLRDEIVRLQKRLGITVVFVTHSRQEALAISDRVAVLNDGQIVQYDSVEAVYREPLNRFVATFVGEANFVSHEGRLMLLRPEQMRIVPEEAGSKSDRQITGTVETRQFLGGAYRYGCSTTEGAFIVTDTCELSVGAPVSIEYDSGDLYDFPPEE